MSAAQGGTSERQIGEILGQVIDRIEQGRREEASLEEKRAAAERTMLADDLGRLIKKHGETHPRVAAVRSAIGALEMQARMAAATAHRIATVKPPEAFAWSAAGRVAEHDGASVAGAEIGFEAVGPVRTPLEGGKTDAEGEFFVTWPAATVRQLVEGKVAVRLTVRRGGTVVHREADTVPVRAGIIRQYDIALPKP
ncbi:MAG: hypothetical protein ACK4QW_09920, partial [Alphaproteobacteria bacterium]